MQNTQALGGPNNELWSNGYPPGIDSTGAYPAMNYVNALPPTRYTGYDDPPHLATGSAEQRGNHNQPDLDNHRTLGITQCIPVPPGPPRLEQYAPAIPGMPNDYPASHVPPPHNIAGPSRGNPSFVHPGITIAEDLKNLASHYLHNPGSHVDKLRMRRSRPGTVEVLILLEIDDTI